MEAKYCNMHYPNEEEKSLARYEHGKHCKGPETIEVVKRIYKQLKEREIVCRPEDLHTLIQDENLSNLSTREHHVMTREHTVTIKEDEIKKREEIVMRKENEQKKFQNQFELVQQQNNELKKQLEEQGSELFKLRQQLEEERILQQDHPQCLSPLHKNEHNEIDELYGLDNENIISSLNRASDYFNANWDDER